MEHLRILAASAALGEFTVPKLAAYSGANEHTVRSVLQRKVKLFEEIRDAGASPEGWAPIKALPSEGYRCHPRSSTRIEWAVATPPPYRRSGADVG